MSVDGMSPDEIEAQTHKYHDARWIYRCRSGRLAVFDHPMRNLIGIVSTVDEAFALEIKREPPPRPTPQVAGLNLDDLELDL